MEVIVSDISDIMEATNKDSPSDQAKIKMNFNAKDFVKNNKKIVSAGVIVIGKFGDILMKTLYFHFQNLFF